MTRMEAEKLSTKTRRIAVAISLYWFVSILMVFINKYLLSSSDLKFNATLFITWFQCIFTVIVYVGLALLGRVYPLFNRFIFFPINLDVVRNMIPLTLVFVGMVSFNNLSLKYVSVSFYMIVRSLATIFNVILVLVYFGERTSNKALICCLIITTGFFIGVQQENNGGDLSASGVLFGVLSSFFAALNGVYIKKSIALVDNNLLKLNYVTNMFAAIIFVPLVVAFGELQEITHAVHSGLFWSTKFWTAMLVSGLFGFLIGYVTSLQIQLTSPLTHNISGTTKSYVQTVLGVLIYNESKSLLWWFSNALVLFGAALYSHARNAEMRLAHNKENKENSGSSSSSSSINGVDKYTTIELKNKDTIGEKI